MTKVKAENIAASVEAVADRLHSAAIHLLRRMRKQDVASGIGPTQLSALSVLVFGGPKTLGELATAEQVKPPTMSRVAAGLKRSRLIDIKPDPHDARRKNISATVKGTLLLQQGRRVDSLAAQLQCLPTMELDRVSAAVDSIGRLLKDWRD
jgi:DNA-binding MarR family transcriptional regulator